MKKKVLLIFLAVLMAFSVCACKKDDGPVVVSKKDKDKTEKPSKEDGKENPGGPVSEDGKDTWENPDGPVSEDGRPGTGGDTSSDKNPSGGDSSDKKYEPRYYKTVDDDGLEYYLCVTNRKDGSVQVQLMGTGYSETYAVHRDESEIGSYIQVSSFDFSGGGEVADCIVEGEACFDISEDAVTMWFISEYDSTGTVVVTTYYRVDGIGTGDGYHGDLGSGTGNGGGTGTSPSPTPGMPNQHVTYLDDTERVYSFRYGETLDEADYIYADVGADGGAVFHLHCGLGGGGSLIYSSCLASEFGTPVAATNYDGEGGGDFYGWWIFRMTPSTLTVRHGQTQEDAYKDEPMVYLRFHSDAPGGGFRITNALDRFETVEEAGGVTITRYNGDDTELSVPSELNGKPVVAIGNSAFAWNDTLRRVVLPEGIQRLEPLAFAHCNALAEIVFPASLKEIGESAFMDTGLRTVTIPDGVTVLGNSAFEQCRQLETVQFGSGISKVSDSAFSECISLRHIDLPGTVVELGRGAFFGTGLEEISLPGSVEKIGEMAFSCCDSLTSVVIPGSVAEAGEGVFRACKNLQTAVIGNGLTRIREKMFYECPKLSSVTIPGSVEKIEGYAFWNCQSLTSVTVPDGLTFVGSWAFNDCPNIAVSFRGTTYTAGTMEEFYSTVNGY